METKRKCDDCIYFKKLSDASANDYCEYAMAYLKSHDACSCWIEKIEMNVKGVDKEK